MDPMNLQTALKMAVALGVVLLVFAGSIYLFKKISQRGSLFGKTNFKSKKEKPIQVLAFQNLGPNRSVYIIKCFNKNLVVGNTHQNINLLCELDDENNQNQSQAFESSLSEHLPHETEKKFKESIAKKFQDIARI
jgi:flagellar biosynthetic protein FliO